MPASIDRVQSPVGILDHQRVELAQGLCYERRVARSNSDV
jgi:hypothetical protein